MLLHSTQGKTHIFLFFFDICKKAFFAYINNQVFLFPETFIWVLSPDYNEGENKITWKRGEKTGGRNETAEREGIDSEESLQGLKRVLSNCSHSVIT